MCPNIEQTIQISIIYYRNNGGVESGGAKEKHKDLMHIIAFHAIDKQALVHTYLLYT